MFEFESVIWFLFWLAFALLGVGYACVRTPTLACLSLAVCRGSPASTSQLCQRDKVCGPLPGAASCPITGVREAGGATELAVVLLGHGEAILSEKGPPGGGEHTCPWLPL